MNDGTLESSVDNVRKVQSNFNDRVGTDNGNKQNTDPDKPRTMFDEISETLISVFQDQSVRVAFTSIRDKLERLAKFHVIAHPDEFYRTVIPVDDDDKPQVDENGQYVIIKEFNQEAYDRIVTEQIQQQLGADRTDPAYPANLSREISELIVSSVAYSVFTAIGFYDDKLKEMLDAEFRCISDVVESMRSDLLATQMKVISLEKGSPTNG